MHRQLTRSFVFLLVALSAVVSRADEPLKWKFKAGDKFTYEMTQNMHTTTAAGPAGSNEIGMNQTMDISWMIDEVDSDGNAVMRQKIDRVKLKMSMPGGQSMEYDTAGDKPPQGMIAMLAPLYKAMTDGDFKITMTPQGKIIKAEAPESLAAALKNIPGAAAMGDLSSPEGIQQMLTQGSMTLPEGETKAGESWTSELEMKLPTGKQEVLTTYEYVGTKEVDGKAYAEIKPKMEIKSDVDPNALMQMSIADQSSEGEILFDRELGRLHSSNIKQKIEMEMNVQGQSITSTIDQTIEMKLKGNEKSSSSQKP